MPPSTAVTLDCWVTLDICFSLCKSQFPWKWKLSVYRPTSFFTKHIFFTENKNTTQSKISHVDGMLYFRGLLILPHFILLLFQSLAQGYDTGTAPEVPMAAKYTPVGGNVNILRHPPPTSISTVTVRPHYSKSTPLMLSCTVYLHIYSDSLHLISGVDHPWNMDRQLQRMIQNCIQFIVCFAQYVISLHYCYQVITANIIHIQRFWSSYGWSVIHS